MLQTASKTQFSRASPIQRLVQLFDHNMNQNRAKYFLVKTPLSPRVDPFRLLDCIHLIMRAK